MFKKHSDDIIGYGINGFVVLWLVVSIFVWVLNSPTWYGITSLAFGIFDMFCLVWVFVDDFKMWKRAEKRIQEYYKSKEEA